MKWRWDVPRVGPCGDAWARAPCASGPVRTWETKQRACPWTYKRHHAPSNIQTQQHLVRVGVQLALRAHRRKKSAQVSRQTCNAREPKYVRTSSTAADRPEMTLYDDFQAMDQACTHLSPGVLVFWCLIRLLRLKVSRRPSNHTRVQAPPAYNCPNLGKWGGERGNQ